MLMQLEQLRHFVKIAELRSFTRAAEATGLSQSALSRSIARLEADLGLPLFERQLRQVELTDSGHLLLQRAGLILSLVDDVRAEIHDDGVTGRIRVGAIPTIAPYLLPKLLQQFKPLAPDASVVIQEDTTDVLLKSLADGTLDLAILALPLSARHLEIEELFEEELLLVLPVGHPLAAKKQIRIADIDTLPFVLLGEAHCLTDNILTFCRRKSFQPVSVERTSQLATVQELVALDHGVSLIPAMAHALDTSQRRVYRSLSGPRPTRKIVMAMNPYRFQTQLCKSFQTCVRAVL